MTIPYRFRQWFFIASFILIGSGCSSTSNKVKGETDNDFNQSSFSYKFWESQEDAIAEQLQKNDIQYIKYGDYRTLVIPTDKNFNLQSSQLKDEDYAGLNNVVKLLKLYPNSKFNVAAFSDNSGSAETQQEETQGQAETVLSYLLANGIPAQKLTAQGYGDKFTLGSNRQIHSSAYNRRVEIQWLKTSNCCAQAQNALDSFK